MNLINWNVNCPSSPWNLIREIFPSIRNNEKCELQTNFVLLQWPGRRWFRIALKIISIWNSDMTSPPGSRIRKTFLLNLARTLHLSVFIMAFPHRNKQRVTVFFCVVVTTRNGCVNQNWKLCLNYKSRKTDHLPPYNIRSTFNCQLFALIGST